MITITISFTFLPAIQTSASSFVMKILYRLRVFAFYAFTLLIRARMFIIFGCLAGMRRSCNIGILLLAANLIPERWKLCK